MDKNFSGCISTKWENYISQKFNQFGLINPKQCGIELCDILFEYKGCLFVGELKFRKISNINGFKEKGLFYYLNNLVEDKYFGKEGIFYQRKDRLVDIKKAYPNFADQKIINFTIQPTIFCPKLPIGKKDECYIEIMRQKKYQDQNLPRLCVISISDIDKFTQNPTKFLNL